MFEIERDKAWVGREMKGIRLGWGEIERERRGLRGRGESRSHGLSSPMQLMGLAGRIKFGSAGLDQARVVFGSSEVWTWPNELDRVRFSLGWSSLGQAWWV